MHHHFISPSIPSTISIIELIVGFLGPVGVIITLILSNFQQKKSDSRMNEHLRSLHLQLIRIQGIMFQQVGTNQKLKKQRNKVFLATGKDLDKYATEILKEPSLKETGPIK